MAHFAHPIRTAVFSMASRFYSEILPSIFRPTQREAERNDRDIRKETLRKEIRQKDERNEARREVIRKRAEADPRRVMAGELTSSFAMR
jgi:hypothetical protein